MREPAYCGAIYMGHLPSFNPFSAAIRTRFQQNNISDLKTSFDRNSQLSISDITGLLSIPFRFHLSTAKLHLVSVLNI
jgi:hypothetical protein